jgi:hypothetical protein
MNLLAKCPDWNPELCLSLEGGASVLIERTARDEVVYNCLGNWLPNQCDPNRPLVLSISPLADAASFVVHGNVQLVRSFPSLVAAALRLLALYCFLLTMPWSWGREMLFAALDGLVLSDAWQIK